MNSLLEENLYAPMADWLHKHGMQHATIATWGRESMLDQTKNYGDFPRMMKYFDIPGNEDSKESGPNGAFIDTKMSSSMAHINGKSRVAVCAYWGMGWGYTQDENIARTSLNYALGTNLFNAHGVLYSLQGGRNEWVPPETHFYQPYWKTWRSFTDYVSRLGYPLSQGRHCADVALVYPLSTIHAAWHSGSKFDSAAAESQAATFGLAKTLYANSLDFDFVDEARLAEATAKSGQINVAGLEFPGGRVAGDDDDSHRRDGAAQEVCRRGGHASSFQDSLLLLRRKPVAMIPNCRKHGKNCWAITPVAAMRVVEHRNDAGGRTVLIRSSEDDATKAIQAAIRPDVITTAKDLAHTHQQVGDQHVYYFVNKQPQQRNVTVTVRSKGRPEIWDARTGEIRPLHRFRATEQGTELRLEMKPHEGVLVVLQPGSLGPQVVEDNLLTIESIEKQASGIEVVATANTAEALHAEVSVDGRVYAGKAGAPRAMASIQLDGLWDCEYRPTMNNKWGDFRYPASDELIGPEAPRMKYRAEEAGSKERPKWESKDVRDDDWQEVTCTFGPYWQVLDPIAAKLDSDSLQKKVVSAAKTGSTVEVDGKAVDWQPYSFSWKHGTDQVDFNQTGNDGLGPVPPQFLILNAARNAPPAVRYLTTRVYSPREQHLYFDFGGQERKPTKVSWTVNEDDGQRSGGKFRALGWQAWVNGKEIAEGKGQPSTELPKVKLQRGWNEVVLRIAQATGRQVTAFAVFHSQPKTPEQLRYMPLSRWFEIAPELVYDYQPEERRSVGWYRFVAPPGAEKREIEFSGQFGRSVDRRQASQSCRRCSPFSGRRVGPNPSDASCPASSPQAGLLRRRCLSSARVVRVWARSNAAGGLEPIRPGLLFRWYQLRSTRAIEG